jgi:predicted site-specific integrase-resolvase
MTDDLLTRDMLAKLIHVKPGTISEWTRRGRIPAVRLSLKVVRYRLSDVLAAILPENQAKKGGEHDR